MSNQQPSPADLAEAERTYEAFADRFGMAHSRDQYIRRLAEAAMHKRLAAEWRANIQSLIRDSEIQRRLGRERVVQKEMAA